MTSTGGGPIGVKTVAVAVGARSPAANQKAAVAASVLSMHRAHLTSSHTSQNRIVYKLCTFMHQIHTGRAPQ